MESVPAPSKRALWGALAVLGSVGAIVAVLLLAVLVACGGYGYWTTTPSYSLSQIQRAVETHDVALFEKHVDIDTAASRFIDDVMAHTSRDLQGQSASPALGAALAEGFVQMMKPRLVEMAKETVLRAIEQGSPAAQAASPVPESARELQEASRGLLGSRPLGELAYLREEGKIAWVGLTMHNEEVDEDLILELKLRDMGGYWKLVELSNVPQVLTEIEAHRVRKLEAANAPLRQAIEAEVKVEQVHKSSPRSRWAFERVVNVHTTVKNVGTQRVAALGGTLWVKAPSGQVLISAPVQASVPIGVGEVQVLQWQFDVNPFLGDWTAVYEAPDNAVRLSLDIRSLQFQDGTELALYDSFDAVPRTMIGSAAP